MLVQKEVKTSLGGYDVLTSKVAIVRFNENESEALEQAVSLIGGIDDLNIYDRSVVIKVGVFNPKAKNHSSVSIVDAVTKCFNEAPKIFIAESDNYKGTALERLQIWKKLFDERVVPFSLSDDPNATALKLADQKMKLSHLLFKPNVLVSTHILRSFEMGSILKNLFGCIPTLKKMKYHKILPKLLADVYEAIGGIDLAVLDGTYFWQKAGERPVRMNTLLVSRDAVAVETVGSILVNQKPEKMPVMREFMKRGLGEGNLRNIEIIGTSIESLKKEYALASKDEKNMESKTRKQGPQTWGGQAHNMFESLIQEGFFQTQRRTIEEVIQAFEENGISTKGNENKIADSLSRRVKKGVMKASKISKGWIYWAE